MSRGYTEATNDVRVIFDYLSRKDEMYYRCSICWYVLTLLVTFVDANNPYRNKGNPKRDHFEFGISSPSPLRKHIAKYHFAEYEKQCIKNNIKMHPQAVPIRKKNNLLGYFATV